MIKTHKRTVPLYDERLPNELHSAIKSEGEIVYFHDIPQSPLKKFILDIIERGDFYDEAWSFNLFVTGDITVSCYDDGRSYLLATYHPLVEDWDDPGSSMESGISNFIEKINTVVNRTDDYYIYYAWKEKKATYILFVIDYDIDNYRQ